MKPGFTILNLNQKFKANCGNTQVLHPQWISSRQHLLIRWWLLIFKCNHDRQPGKGKKKTLSGPYNVPKLKQIKETIKLKHRGNLKAGVCLLQDNMPIHTGRVKVAGAANTGFELLLSPLIYQTQLIWPILVSLTQIPPIYIYQPLRTAWRQDAV